MQQVTGGKARESSGAARSIIFMVADDLGFNDVSFHGSAQIPTPALDELAATGLVLDNYHAMPVCSPTRASLLSGRHAIHHGIYMPFSQGSALRLNLSYTLLPRYLQRLGYATHAVGKWHLGQNELAALPTGRGFDTHYGYWAGAEDYVTCAAHNTLPPLTASCSLLPPLQPATHNHEQVTHVTDGAYDLADGTRTCFAGNGTYSTYLFARRAVQIIEEAAAALAPVPFFLYLAFQNVHWPLEAPQPYLDRFANTTGGEARRQAHRNLPSPIHLPRKPHRPTRPPVCPPTQPPAHPPSRLPDHPTRAGGGGDGIDPR